MIRKAVLLLGLAALLIAAPASKLSIYDFNLPDIDGKMISFAAFKGKTLLIVNVASNSRYTPQYKGLEDLYEKYKGGGLVVLAFPSNDFGSEEPDNEAKIKEFVAKNYHVSFPLFSKLAVRGDEITPLYHFLTKESPKAVKGDVHWNFTKFLIDRNGKLVSRFEPGIAPDDPELIMAIEDAMKAKERKYEESKDKEEPSPQTPPSAGRDDRQGR
jgi:glutathione peroxidase